MIELSLKSLFQSFRGQLLLRVLPVCENKRSDEDKSTGKHNICFMTLTKLLYCLKLSLKNSKDESSSDSIGSYTKKLLKKLLRKNT